MTAAGQPPRGKHAWPTPRRPAHSPNLSAAGLGWLGVALFVRRPRGLEITSEGEALLPDLRDAFDRMTNALERVGRKANSGTLNVSLVTTFALGWLVPRLHRFQAKHPEIEVRMTTSQKRVDFAREDVDCAIRFTVQPEPELHATRLFSDVLTPLCGKRYHDKLKTLDDLKRVPFIDMTHDPEWPIWLRAVGLGFCYYVRGQKNTAPAHPDDIAQRNLSIALDGHGHALARPLFADTIVDDILRQSDKVEV